MLFNVFGIRLHVISSTKLLPKQVYKSTHFGSRNHNMFYTEQDNFVLQYQTSSSIQSINYSCFYCTNPHSLLHTGLSHIFILYLYNLLLIGKHH